MDVSYYQFDVDNDSYGSVDARRRGVLCTSPLDAFCKPAVVTEPMVEPFFYIEYVVVTVRTPNVFPSRDAGVATSIVPAGPVDRGVHPAPACSLYPERSKELHVRRAVVPDVVQLSFPSTDRL